LSFDKGLTILNWLDIKKKRIINMREWILLHLLVKKLPFWKVLVERVNIGQETSGNPL